MSLPDVRVPSFANCTALQRVRTKKRCAREQAVQTRVAEHSKTTVGGVQRFVATNSVTIDSVFTFYADARKEQRYEAARRGIPWTEGRCSGLLWCVANTIAVSWTYTPKDHASAFAADTETPFVSHRPCPGPQCIIHPCAVHHTQTRLPATRCRKQTDPIAAYPRKRKHTEKMRGRATKPHCIVQLPHLSFGITIVRTHVLRPSLATRLTRRNECFTPLAAEYYYTHSVLLSNRHFNHTAPTSNTNRHLAA